MENQKTVPVEKVIADTEMALKQVISNSGLNVMVIELMLRNLYTEVKLLSQQQLNHVIIKAGEEQKEDTDGNTNAAG